MYSYYVLLTFLCRRNSRSRSRSPSSRYCNLFTLFSHLIYCQSESTFKLTVELLSVQSTAPCTFSTVRFHYIQSDISLLLLFCRERSRSPSRSSREHSRKHRHWHWRISTLVVFFIMKDFFQMFSVIQDLFVSTKLHNMILLSKFLYNLISF